MEGMLFKWTSYLSGWQPRYFVLDGPFLSYYISHEDVGKTTEGSITMSMCEINVHPSDSKRFDLKLPGEQVIYLKVQGSGGRQQWLVALGSAKACLTGIHSKTQKERSKGDHALRAKMSEMQLYCHLLVEQMQMLQGCAGLPECQAQSLVEASSFLRQTCCQFLMSLEDCMAMCTCRAGTQQCRLLSPVSPSAVDCPNPHHKPPFMHSASLTEGLVLDGGLEAPYGQTVKRNLEEMSVLHAQRHSMASTSHQGASVTDDRLSDSRNTSAMQKRH